MPLRGLHPDMAQRQCVAAPTDRPIGVNDPAMEDQDLLLQLHVKVGPWEELRRDLRRNRGLAGSRATHEGKSAGYPKKINESVLAPAYSSY